MTSWSEHGQLAGCHAKGRGAISPATGTSFPSENAGLTSQKAFLLAKASLLQTPSFLKALTDMKCLHPGFE